MRAGPDRESLSRPLTIRHEDQRRHRIASCEVWSDADYGDDLIVQIQCAPDDRRVTLEPCRPPEFGEDYSG